MDASYKQLNFIKNLLEQKAVDFEIACDALGFDNVSDRADLNSNQASRMINWLLDQDNVDDRTNHE